MLKRWPLNGGSTLETILIKFRGNASACLSLDGAFFTHEVGLSGRNDSLLRVSSQ